MPICQGYGIAISRQYPKLVIPSALSEAANFFKKVTATVKPTGILPGYLQTPSKASSTNR
jgi:hypothetical protein